MANSKTPKNNAIIGSKKGSSASLKGWIPNKGWANAIMKAVIPKGKVSVIQSTEAKINRENVARIVLSKKGTRKYAIKAEIEAIANLSFLSNFIRNAIF